MYTEHQVFVVFLTNMILEQCCHWCYFLHGNGIHSDVFWKVYVFFSKWLLPAIWNDMSSVEEHYWFIIREMDQFYIFYFLYNLGKIKDSFTKYYKNQPTFLIKKYVLLFFKFLCNLPSFTVISKKRINPQFMFKQN